MSSLKVNLLEVFTILSRELTVKNEEGLHSRPAMDFAKEAMKFKSVITIEKDGEEYDAKSMLLVLSACICQGDRFVLKVSGEDEIEAVETLTTLVNSFE